MIDAKRVHEIVEECLYEESELADMRRAAIEPAVVEGITASFGFHPVKLEAHRKEVLEMLMQLPVMFRKSEGGGWTFLNACNTEDGEQWGQHSDVQMLFVLGIGLKLAAWCMPKDMWSALPGGMPYVVINI